MTSKPCTTCRHSAPYDEHLISIRMCDAISSKPVERHTVEFMRAFGECGPEGRLHEAAE